MDIDRSDTLHRTGNTIHSAGTQQLLHYRRSSAGTVRRLLGRTRRSNPGKLSGRTQRRAAERRSRRSAGRTDRFHQILRRTGQRLPRTGSGNSECSRETVPRRKDQRN